MLKLPRQSLLLRREALTIDQFEIEIEIETDWLLRFLKRSRTAFGDLKKKEFPGDYLSFQEAEKM